MNKKVNMAVLIGLILLINACNETIQSRSSQDTLEDIRRARIQDHFFELAGSVWSLNNAVELLSKRESGATNYLHDRISRIERNLGIETEPLNMKYTYEGWKLEPIEPLSFTLP